MKLLLPKTMVLYLIISLALLFNACSKGHVDQKEGAEIARKAYIYAYPIVKNYLEIYKTSVDKNNPAYKAPFNQFYGQAQSYSPYTKNVHYPNLDTPVGYACLDLRKEPLVLTVPKVDSARFYSIQLTDLYAYNFAYLGTRDNDNEKTRYLLTGPDWNGEVPKEIKTTIRAKSKLVVAKSRTKYLGAKDLWWVRHYQRSYTFTPLSEYEKTSAPAKAEKLPLIKVDSTIFDNPEFFNFFNYLMQFCEIDSSDEALFDQFARIGLLPGKRLVFTTMSLEKRQIFNKGLIAGKEAIVKRASADAERISKLYGDRAYFAGNYLNRAAGAYLGLYGSSMTDYYEYIYNRDEDGQPLDCTDKTYVLRFARWDLPPVKAWWSLTMYNKKTGGLVRNELNRYQFTMEMEPDMRKAADNSINIYFRRKNPEGIKERNWLPAPDGPFVVILRMYWPKKRFLNYKYPIPQIRKSG